MIIRESDVARLWSKIRKGDSDECWPWQAKARLVTGYGLLNIYVTEGRRRNVVASRIVCKIAHGEPPYEGAHALHSCDNPPCCNPKHLRWGTPKDNAADAIERGRNSPPPLNASYRRRDTQPKGGRVHNQSLDEAKVREIWRLHLAGMNTSRIAEVVGAKQHAVADVARGRSWRHLEDAPSIEALKAGGARRGDNGFNDTARARVLEVRAFKKGRR